MTPADSLQALKNGNDRFVTGTRLNRDLHHEVEATARAQHPFGVVLGCMDSRVPHETVFDQGIGDIFSVRIAGNYANTDIIGSIEFATKIVGSNLIVVLGHTECGAVRGACDSVELGNLTYTLSHLKPAIEAVDGIDGERSSNNLEYVQRVAEANVHYNVKKLTDGSEVLTELVGSGALHIIGAMYDTATGKVTFYE